MKRARCLVTLNGFPECGALTDFSVRLAPPLVPPTFDCTNQTKRHRCGCCSPRARVTKEQLLNFYLFFHYSLINYIFFA